MSNFQAVKRFVTKTAKKELAPTRVVKINMREGVTSSDGEPAYRIDIIFDGERIDAERLGNMSRAIKAHFWAIKEEHTPVYSFLRPEDEEWFYAPRKY